MELGFRFLAEIGWFGPEKMAGRRKVGRVGVLTRGEGVLFGKGFKTAKVYTC